MPTPAELSKMIEIGIDARKSIEGSQKIQQATKGIDEATKKTRKEVEATEGSLNRLGQTGDFLKSKLLGLVSVLGVGFSAGYAIQQMHQFEEAMVEVVNTTGLAGEQLADLEHRMVSLSSKIPSTTTTISQLVNTAHQMGIRGVPEMIKFAETMERIGAVTDLRGDSGAKALARLLRAGGESLDGIAELGGLVNELGDEFGAAGNEIIGMSTLIVQMNERFGVTTKEALALSAAMSRLGADSGGAAIALTKIFSKFSPEFIKNSGGATKALLVFLEGLNKIKEENSEAFTKVLEELDLDDRRVARALLPMIKGYSELQKALEMSADSAGNLKALQEESDRVFGQTSKQLEKLKNSLDGLLQLLSHKFDPILQAIIKSLTDGVRWMTGFSEETDKTSTTSKVLIVSLTALSGLLTLLTAKATVLSGLAVAQWFLGVELAVLKTNFAFQLLLTELAAVSVALAAITGFKLGGWLYENVKIFRDFGDSFAEAVQIAWEQVKYIFEAGIAQVKKLINDLEAWIFRKLADIANSPSLSGFLSALPGGQGILAGLTAFQLPLNIAADILEQNSETLAKEIVAIGEKSDETIRLISEARAKAQAQSDADFNKKLKDLGSKSAKPDQEFVGPPFPGAQVDVSATNSAKSAVEGLVGAVGKSAEAARQAKAELEKMFKTLEFEARLVGATSEERERAKAVIEVQTLAEKAYGKNVEQVNKVVADYIAQLEELQKLRRREEGGKELEALNKELTTQIDLIDKAADEREHYALITQYLAGAEKVYGENTEEARIATELFVDRLRYLDRLKDLREIFDGIGDSFAENVDAMIFDSKRLQDSIEDFLRSITRMTFQKAVSAPLSDFLSSGLTGIFKGGLVPSANGNAFEGGRLVSAPSFVRHSGGLGTVAEMGTEGIFPLERDSRGRLGVRGSGSSSPINVTINVNGVSDSSGFRRTAPQIAREISRSVRSAGARN